MDLDERINAVATVNNAKEYENENEKFIFCLDLLEISANHTYADFWVNRLEDRFDGMNQNDSGYWNDETQEWDCKEDSGLPTDAW